MNPVSSKEIAFGDLERELSVTRTVLERLPAEHYGWKPHEKWLLNVPVPTVYFNTADDPTWVFE